MFVLEKNHAEINLLMVYVRPFQSSEISMMLEHNLSCTWRVGVTVFRRTCLRGSSSTNDKAALRLKEYDFTLGAGVTRGNYICATS